MGRVRILPPDIVKQIAAGEVIERPASAVKELIENSIDAGAMDISVYIKTGGREYIKVIDNGIGIASEDVPLVFQKYTTSKIKDLEDLMSISTLGFRGEALHSIAFASQKVILTTRYLDESMGTKVVVSEGKVKSVHRVARNVGTTVEIFDLFARLPARRKFLKSVGYETRKIMDVIYRYIFAHPDKRFSLYVDEKLKIKIMGNKPENIYYLYVKRKPDSIRVLSHNISNIASSASSTIWMFFDPLNAQPFLFITINGRPVVTGNIYGMVKAIFRNFFGAENLPSLALWFWLPPNVVDPNIHPAKLEVDIKDKELIKTLLLSMLEKLSEAEEHPEEMEGTTWNTVNIDYGINVGNINTDKSKSKSSVVKLFSPSEEQRQVEEDKYSEIPKIIEVIDNTFIVYKYKGQIKVADQHALMEGILFQILWSKKEIYKQPLSVPWQFTVVDPREAVKQLEELGFSATVMSENSIVVRAIPSIMSLRIWNKELMRELISSLGYKPLNRKQIADIACKLSIKAGDNASVQFLQVLIKLGEDFPEYKYDPHGRPAVIALNTDLLKKLFKRK